MRLKKLFLIGFSLLFVTTLFGQTYEEYLAKAKQYEAEKRWAYALGAYYDAMGTDLSPEEKKEALDGYVTLQKAILAGNPGLGKFNAFTLHDEWKNLLIDAEKFGSSFNSYILTIGDLVQGDLNYENRTASYSAEISYTRSEKYECTIGVIEQGLKRAYSKDWTDIPTEWPFFSVSYEKNNKYNDNGALTFSKKSWSRVKGEYNKTIYMNAFAYDGINYEDVYEKYYWNLSPTPNLFDYKFNIVDENGKELVKGKRWLLGESKEITFTDIPVSVMEIIDSGKAFVNPVACYLQYGTYNEYDDKGGRTFIKNLPEVELPINKTDYICWNNLENEINMTVRRCMLYYFDFGLVEIPESNIMMGKTEVTQELYQLLMEYNPNDLHERALLNPVSNLSWYDVIEFCNFLSNFFGLDCVYSVDGETNPENWEYDYGLLGELVIDSSLNGFRLPTLEEWKYAAKGGEDYIYSGSNDIDEVAWYYYNSDSKLKNVAQKKANAYGLYDMSGNVGEWTSSKDLGDRIYCGGSVYSAGRCEIDGDYDLAHPGSKNPIGFRLVRTITEENTDN